MPAPLEFCTLPEVMTTPGFGPKLMILDRDARTRPACDRSGSIDTKTCYPCIPGYSSTPRVPGTAVSIPFFDNR